MEKYGSSSCLESYVTNIVPLFNTKFICKIIPAYKHKMKIRSKIGTKNIIEYDSQRYKWRICMENVFPVPGECDQLDHLPCQLVFQS